MKNKYWLWWDAWHLQHSTNLLLMTFSKQSILLVDELEARLVIGCLGKHEMLSLQTFIEPAHDTGDGHQVSWLPRTLKLWELWRCQRDCWVHVILVLVKHSWNFDSGRYYFTSSVLQWELFQWVLENIWLMMMIVMVKVKWEYQSLGPEAGNSWQLF